MQIKVTVKKDQLSQINRNIGQIEQIVSKAATDVEATAKRSILLRQSKADVGREVTSGVIRNGKVKRKSRIHYPSRPGYPPNNDTGMLANSLGSRMIAKDTAEIYASAEYALGLEIGTSRTKARPFLVPALEKVRPSFVKAVKNTLGG